MTTATVIQLLEILLSGECKYIYIFIFKIPDSVIYFCLRYLTLSVLSEEDQARTHVFSSFFYKRLTTRPAKALRRSHPVEDDPKLSPAEKRHSRVKSWTKNINIFDKDFIIIPINEQ